MPFAIPSDSARILQALRMTHAVVEFDLSGRILDANENFCRLLSYSKAKIIGRHHSMFAPSDDVVRSNEEVLWEKLRQGEFEHCQYKCVANGHRDLWIDGTYIPVLRAGKAYKVFMIATDVTDAVFRAADNAGKVAAISKSQAVIEFNPDGYILDANPNFLGAMGFELIEVQGRHHSMFCGDAVVGSREYRQFWERLKTGEFIADEFERIGKNGRIVHIQASYNPIFDTTGRVMKVVKFATDVTARVQNVEALASSLNDLANGDLTTTLAEPFVPALERLRVDFNATVQRLSEALSAVARNAETIAASSAEVRSAADDLSRRTENQAASLEETAAALDEITTTVAESSRRAHEASNLVDTTRVNAEKSGAVVREAIEAMGAIKTSSRQISGIVGLIDEIAFQTNLLALNAGVEAARAGDAGKGFAVVAQEVRALSQRSASAAKEIKALIASSTEQVTRGVTLVDQTGAALSQIVAQIQQISTNVAAIVETAKEQSTGLLEVNKALNVLDRGTQQNAAMVEQTNAATGVLANEARGLFSLVGEFHLHRSLDRLNGTCPCFEHAA